MSSKSVERGVHLISDDNIQLPDLSFFHYCEKAYRINRGVYNTIDSIFYGKGVRNILTRRQILLSFLDYIIQMNHQETSHLKFGHGGLTAKINEYWLGEMHNDDKKTIY